MAIFGTHASEIIDAADGMTEGDDWLWAMGGDDTIYGLGGNDTLFGGVGADTIDGGAGSDTARYSDSTAGVIVSLASGRGSGGTAEGDTLFNIENLYGSTYADRLYGDGGSNVLTGWYGNDVLKGGGGSDRLYGDSGSDTLEGGAGADYLDGGEDTFEEPVEGWYPEQYYPDTASYVNSPGGVFVSLLHGRGDGGDAKGDVLVNIENLTGSAYADTLWGDNGSNRLEGLDGNDTLNGFGGADTLLGGNGADILTGGDRQDILTGGRDADVFMFTSLWDSTITAPDHVTDFARVQGDRINLSALDANTATAADDPFHWIGNEVAWDASGAGQLRFKAGYVEGDVDGDGNADFRIQVSARDPLDTIDFVL
jgi:Ca2+-binding RTX toxin-like protein